ncbi:hypothetical protein [Legionella impletisoli]|uniref:Uncharacterized protein n=1 Tax=Legionella impletisoli TaxID=343510 RepID=A0A917JXI1_9GAMM|nr:hypothetical protein [Legionella impletisoli]GGI89954.1 hypothetical protein GCM10007966_18360 [Legionella impletisoli]
MASVLRKVGYFAESNAGRGVRAISTILDVGEEILAPLRHNLDSVERMDAVRPSKGTTEAKAILASVIEHIEAVLENQTLSSTTSPNF